MRQFIVENKQIHDGLIQLEGKDYRYLRQVLRVRAGDMISVRLPDGSLNNATVARIDEGARRITLQLCAGTGETITRGVQAEELTGAAGADGNSASGMGGVEYWLFQFLPRPQKFELIVRQATECGVSGIVPVVGEYTEKSSAQSLMGAKRERLERIVREARQQSGSPVDTKVLEPMNLEKAIELWQTESTVVEPAVPEPGRRVETTAEHREGRDVAFVLSERGDCDGNLRATVQKADSIKRAAIAVGSEGGISPDEVRLLEEKGLFVPVHFAVNILRCETAALYGIAAVQCEIMQSKQ